MSRERDFLHAAMASDAKLKAIHDQFPPCPTCATGSSS